MTYEERVKQLEDEGLTTSDAQSVADVEESKKGKCCAFVIYGEIPMTGQKFCLNCGKEQPAQPKKPIKWEDLKTGENR